MCTLSGKLHICTERLYILQTGLCVSEDEDTLSLTVQTFYDRFICKAPSDMIVAPTSEHLGA